MPAAAPAIPLPPPRKRYDLRGVPDAPTQGWRLSASGMTTSVTYHGRVVVLTVSGDIDMANAVELTTALGAVLLERPLVLIVDLSAVEYLGSAALRVLAAAHARIGVSGRLAVVANTSATRRPIELTDLNELLAVYSTLDGALTGAHGR
jgi:anti-sigma B factor antagonist